MRVTVNLQGDNHFSETFELSCDQLITFECFYHELDNFTFDLIRPSLVSERERKRNFRPFSFIGAGSGLLVFLPPWPGFVSDLEPEVRNF